MQAILGLWRMACFTGMMILGSASLLCICDFMSGFTDIHDNAMNERQARAKGEATWKIHDTNYADMRLTFAGAVALGVLAGFAGYGAFRKYKGN